MKILAIETSSIAGSVAALVDGELAAELTLPPTTRSAKGLAPAMRELLDDVGWTPDSVDLVAVAIGPGSFTGLRVGVAITKAFAYAVGAEVMGVDTLEAIALRIPTTGETIAPAFDAGRGDVVGALFRREAEGVVRLQPTELAGAEAWIESIPKEAIVTGPALVKLPQLRQRGYRIADPELWNPSAEAVGRIAHRDYLAGRRDDIWRLAPVYYRPSAAEEKRASGAT